MPKVNGKIIYPLIVLLSLGLFITHRKYGFSYLAGSKGQNKLAKNESVPVSERLKVKFFEKDSFFDSVNNIPDKSLKDYGKIRGSIVPHHLLAADMIAENIKLLSASKPKKIIIIGPNHDEVGDYKIIAGSLDWETEIGILQSDNEIGSKIKGINIIGVDNKVIENDHSVSGIMPFIKYYLPKSVVTPFILKSTLTLEEMGTFSKFLDEYSNSDSVIIVSTDFSHYLKEKDATGNDIKTLSHIKNFDVKSIMNLSNDYLDSPLSVITLLLLMTEMNADDIHVIGHSNSAQITNDFESETTSYYSLIFTESNK